MIELAVYCNFSNRYVCYSDSNLILMIYETFILAFDFIKLSLIHSFLVCLLFCGKDNFGCLFLSKEGSSRHSYISPSKTSTDLNSPSRLHCA